MATSEDTPREVLFANAQYALEQIRSGKAVGSESRLQFRSAIEKGFGELGAFLGRFPWVVVFVVVVVTVGLSLGLLKAEFETDAKELWIETGGRLEDETDYTESVLGEGSEATVEAVIQVGKNGKSAITQKALLEHLEVVTRAAQNAFVSYGGYDWKYQDLCDTVEPAKTHLDDLDNLISEFIPCPVASVLDCFWEGSQVHKLAEPHFFNVAEKYLLNWSNLNMSLVISAMNADLSKQNQSLDAALEVILKSLHVHSQKLCLDPKSPICPRTAPNWNQTINITEALLAKCKFFVVEWHPDIIISGEEWKTGGGSPAVQTLFRLGSVQSVHKSLEAKLNRNMYRSDATELLKKWRKELSRVVYDAESHFTETNVYVWTDDSAQDVLEQFSGGSEVLLAVGYFLMALYAGIVFINIRSVVKSRVNVGLVGVVFVVLACLSGLGLSSLFGLKLNPMTTQVLPFLVLGLGVDDMFVLAHSFFHTFDEAKGKGIEIPEISRKCLEKVGHSMTLTSVTNSAGFFLAAIIPVPAMREFALQVGICVVLDYFVLLFAFPAYLCIDGQRIRKQKSDLFCCVDGSLAPECLRRGDDDQPTDKKPPRTESKIELTEMGKSNQEIKEKSPRSAGTMGDRFVCNIYSPLLRHPAVHIIVLGITLVLVLLSGYYSTKVVDGLDVTEVVPSDAPEYGFAAANAEYFSVRSLTIVHDYKNDFSSAAWQKTALDYHREFAKVKWILKSDDQLGNDSATVSEPFWLKKMIEFYENVQDRRSSDLQGNGSLSVYSTIIQVALNVTSDESWQVLDTYDGPDEIEVNVIPPDHFYTYLTLWVNVDLISPLISLPDFRPVPPIWQLSPQPAPKAKPLTYAAMPMLASGLTTARDEIQLIKDVRKIIEDWKAYGMSAYPRGLSFSLFEQYLNLRNHLYLAIGLILIACLVATSVLLLSIWSGVIMVVMLLLTAFEVYGFLGMADIQFSAIPCVSVIVSVGATVEFTAPLCLMFVKVVGSRDKRVHYALLYRFVPIFNGSVSTFLGFIMLAFSEFEFIFKYFFLIFLALLVLGTFNGLVVLPVLLYYAGPPPQVVPIDEAWRANGGTGDTEKKMPDQEVQNGTEGPYTVEDSVGL